MTTNESVESSGNYAESRDHINKRNSSQDEASNQSNGHITDGCITYREYC